MIMASLSSKIDTNESNSKGACNVTKLVFTGTTELDPLRVRTVRLKAPSTERCLIRLGARFPLAPTTRTLVRAHEDIDL